MPKTITTPIKDLHNLIGENILDNFNMHCYVYQAFERCSAAIEEKEKKFIQWDSYHFPIEKLDGVLVHITIRVTTTCMLLIIDSRHIEDENSYNGMFNFNTNILKHIDKHCEAIARPHISFELFMDTFITLNYYLRRSKFVKINQQFEVPSKNADCISAFKRMFKGNANISYYSSPECVVCYDQTNTKTACGHILCIPCWDKINPSLIDHEYEEDEEDYDEEDYDRLCPICRKRLCK